MAKKIAKKTPNKSRSNTARAARKKPARNKSKTASRTTPQRTNSGGRGQRAGRTGGGSTAVRGRVSRHGIQQPWTRSGSQNVLAVLYQDHQKVRRLLAELKSTHSAQRGQELLEKVEQELKIHTQVEEEIFYPAYRDAVRSKEDKQLFYEATEEHRAVDVILPDVKRAEPGSEVFAARAKVLKEIVEHHAEEEENDMFPRARKAMSEEELERLGTEIEERKQHLQRGWLKSVTSLLTGGE